MTLIKAGRNFGCWSFDLVTGQRQWGLGFGKGMDWQRNELSSGENRRLKSGVFNHSLHTNGTLISASGGLVLAGE